MLIDFLMLAAPNFAAWSVVDWIKLVIIVCAAIAIMWVAITYFGIKIPEPIVKIFWIVVICCVALVAIGVIASLW